jgi:hypothetical protein
VLKVVLTTLNLLVFLYLAIVVNEKVRVRQQTPVTAPDSIHPSKRFLD